MRKYLAQIILIVFIMLASLPAFAQDKASKATAAGRPASAEAALPKPKFDVSRFKGPIGKRYVLPDGMILLVKEERSLPMVTISMIIRAGSVMEPYKKAGLAHLTAALLTKGAAGMSAMDISGKIDFIGASLGVGGSTDYAAAHLTVLKKDLDTGFSLLSKVLIQPTFAQPEIDRTKKDIKAGILREEQSPGYVAQKAYQKMVFGEENPYGRPVEGTAASLDAITRNDIVTSVVVTHDIPLAFEVADYMAFLHEGEVCYVGGTDGILKTDMECVREFIDHSGRADLACGERRSSI